MLFARLSAGLSEAVSADGAALTPNIGAGAGGEGAAERSSRSGRSTAEKELDNLRRSEAGEMGDSARGLEFEETL